MIKEGDYFIAFLINDSSHHNNPLVSLNLSAESKKIYTCNITLDRLYHNTEYTRTDEIPLLFKYLGNNEVIELLTKRKLPIVYDEEKYIESINIFESVYEYDKAISNLVLFSSRKLELLKLDNRLKLEYFKTVTEHGSEIKEKLENFFDYTKREFEEKTIEDYYCLATVDNMMYDLDKELEGKNKVKVKNN